MSVSPLHLIHQGPVIGSLLGALARRPGERARAGAEGGPAHGSPGPLLTATLGPRPRRLVDEYIRHVGGEPGWYRGVLPPHLFPQWGFPLLARTLAPLPYDLRRILNAGCRVSVHHPLPDGEPLVIRARLEEVDDDGRRAIFRQHLVTGTGSVPEALEAWITALVPLGRRGKGGDAEDMPEKKEKREKPVVPHDARELCRWRLGPGCGRDFAVLTGDVNPIHWLAPYARLAGFRRPILHGFSGLARLWEALNRHLLDGRVERLCGLEARFVRPLGVPSVPVVYLDAGDPAPGFHVGLAPGGPAYFSGTYTVRKD